MFLEIGKLEGGVFFPPFLVRKRGGYCVVYLFFSFLFCYFFTECRYLVSTVCLFCIYSLAKRRDEGSFKIRVIF